MLEMFVGVVVIPFELTRLAWGSNAPNSLIFCYLIIYLFILQKQVEYMLNILTVT